MTTRETTAPAPPIPPAATLLLLRERAGLLEVLMMRREQALRFMGGMWVFPGGRVDPSDCTPAAAALVAADVEAEPAPCALDGAPLPDSLVRGLRVAACRETFEEAGLLLVRRDDGRPLSPDELRVLLAERERVTRTPGGFTELLTVRGLRLDVGRLVYWSHWITPSHEPRRFDTRFFALAMPTGQAASIDHREATELAWLAPVDACRAAERNEMQLAPPTLLTLEDLDDAHARHGDMAAMLAAERGRATPPVMPRIRMEGDTVHVVMPWDPAYAHAQGDGSIAATGGYPPHLTRRRSSLIFRRGDSTR